MRQEAFLQSSRYRGAPNIRLLTRAEAKRELEQSCGRFRSLHTSEERLRSFVAENMNSVDPLGDGLLLGGGVPLNWQRLLSYLHEEQVIPSPHFMAREQRNDYPRWLHVAGLAPVKVGDVSDGHEVLYGGYGASPDRETAMSKAVGEALERHFLSTYRRESLRPASYADLARREVALDIHQFDLFLDWQKKRFPGLSWNDSSIFHWVQGETLDGRPTLLPAQLVYWNYERALPDQSREPTIFMQTTSGSAGHFTRHEAILAALLEAIQRDAFLIFWLNGLSPRRIDPSTIRDARTNEWIEQLRAYNLEPVFLNTTSDLGIPTATCVLVDRANPEYPIFSIGSSSGFTIEDTLLNSAIESFAVAHSISHLEPYVLPDPYEPFISTTLSRMERLRAWQGKEMAPRIEFFLSGTLQSADEFIGDAPRCDTPQKQLAHVVSELSRHGYEIYLFEVENKVLKDIGYHVVRAIVPALIPLHLVEFAAPLKARRLKEAPAALGLTAAKKPNPWPHPFP